LLLLRYGADAAGMDGSGSFGGTRVVGPASGEAGSSGGGVGQCFAWNATARQLERAFGAVLPPRAPGGAPGPEVHVSRTGRGDATSRWGFTHALTFHGGAVRGDVSVAAAQHLQLGATVFVPTAATLAAATGAGVRGGDGLAAFAQKAGADAYPWATSALVEVAYLGPLVWANGSHSVEQLAWTVQLDAFGGAPSAAVVANFTAGGAAVELAGYNVTVALSAAVPAVLRAGDAWVLLIARCDGTEAAASASGLAPAGALQPVPGWAVGVRLTALVEGHAPAKQLTLGAAFGGDAGGSVPLYLVNPTFAVAAPGTEVQRVLLGDTFTPGGEAQSWGSDSPTWTLTFGGETTRCLDWNAVNSPNP
jgi:hypothetical protein